MKLNRRYLFLRIIVLSILMVFGNTLVSEASIDVELDTQTHIIYQSITSDTLCKAFTEDKKSAKNLYDDGYFLLYGKVISKNDNSKKITVGAIESGSSETIICRIFDKADIEYVSGLEVGKTVRMYGSLSVGLDYSINFTVNGISKAETVNISEDMYSEWGESPVRRSSLKKKNITGSNVFFYIPSEWERVEHDIQKEELGSITGYQYRLNEIEKKDAFAESLFLCYFDKITGVDKNDINSDKAIEEAILRDILNKDSLKQFPLKTVRTYYGPKYRYYRDIFTKMTGEKYQVEAIFQEKGDGIILCLYIYKEPRHVKDIMLVLRFMEAL